MCAVSMVGDHYRDIFNDKPWAQRLPAPTWPVIIQQQSIGPTREEFETLKRQVEEMKLLLARAKEYDERNGEPECEIEEKMDLLRKVAKLVGVNLDDVIGPPKPQ